MLFSIRGIQVFHNDFSRTIAVLMKGNAMTDRKDSEENPDDLCAWNDNSDCENCGDRNLLFCKVDSKLQKAFLILFAPCITLAFFGLTLMGIMTGHWWMLILYGAFFMVLFPAIEFGVLCRHCPFYGNSSKMLTCVAGSGIPKTYKYNPRPLNRWERLTMYCYYTFMIGFPIFTVGYGVYYVAANSGVFSNTALLAMIGLEIGLILTFIAFNYCLNVYICRKCVNFSCPWNRVPKKVVDDYLRINPVMKEAWEKTGYKLEELKVNVTSNI